MFLGFELSSDTLQQVLVEHAKRLALEYPQRYRYQYIHAAETLRAPYWDWAATGSVPPVTVPETLRIRVPNNHVLEEVELQNPLFAYKFPQAALDGRYGPLDSQKRTQTLRCLSPESYPASANGRISERAYKQWVVCVVLGRRSWGSLLTLIV